MSEKITFSASPPNPAEGVRLELKNPYSSSTPIGGTPKSFEAPPSSPVPTAEELPNQQLDLTAEPGWDGAKQPYHQNPDYRALEFEVEKPSDSSTPVAEATSSGQSQETRPMESGVKPWEEPPSERDWRRIDREAKAYFDHFEDPQDIIDLRGDLAKHLQEVKEATWKEMVDSGLISNPGEAGYEEQPANKLAIRSLYEAIDRAKTDKIAELVEGALDYEDDSRKERKGVNKARESLAKLLDMPVEQFDQLRRDWQQHEISEAHGEAQKEDKNYKVGEQRRAARAEIAGLERKYGGVLGEISRLSLDREAGGVTELALSSYLERKKKIESLDNGLVDRDSLQEVTEAVAIRDLQAQLKPKYQAEGLSEEQIQSKLDESTEALKTWLQHINNGTNPLADLQKYENQNNKEQMLAAKRQKISEFIGSAIILRSLRRLVSGEKSPAEQPAVNVAEILERGVDHGGSHARSGGEVLLNSDKAETFRGRVMAQLEMYRTLGKNEGALTKSLLAVVALEKSLGAGLQSAWEAIPQETKNEARKKVMLKKAALASALSRLSARAAAKARKAAATGASAGVMWRAVREV